jgi:CTP:molybdopterin cytidylyltransferase MocA
VDDGAGPWVLRGLAALAGCAPLAVVVGASGDAVRALLPPGVLAIDNPDHLSGMGSSLRVGLRALPAEADAALVMLVDLPDVGAQIADRVRAAAGTDPPGVRAALLRAGFRGTPGHPVLLGRDHWAGVLADAAGDAGARDYLRGHRSAIVECGDLGTGRDVDIPPLP